MWPDSIREPLRAVARTAWRARHAQPIDEETLENLDHAALQGILSDADFRVRFGSGARVVYLFEAIDGDAQETRTRFDGYYNGLVADEREHVKFPRRNNPVNNVLYVGSCRNGVCRRLREHAIDAGNGTYALRLQRWFQGHGYRIYLRRYDVDNAVLQLIEDAIAEQLSPAFGRRGGN